MQALRRTRGALRALVRQASCGAPAGVSPPATVFDASTMDTRELRFVDRGDGAAAARSLSWYCCGPTVYDAAHVGHARTYVTTDIVRRVVEDWLRVPVRFVLGLTDVDDKIIDRAASTGVSPSALARRFEAEFVEDMCRLNVRAPSAVSRVTEHVPQIIAFVERLVARGHAYRSGDGSVYFDHTTFVGEHPTWARAQPDDDACGAHASVRADGQRHARDFALWKAVPGGVLGESAWQSPFGLGRPGWHIECSAMSHAFLGARLDLHSGGIDLCFPHHANEIIQSQSALGVQPWVSYWLHTGHVHIDGRKMSKSLKNFVTIREMLARTSPAVFRVFCLQHPYRAPVTYSDDALREAEAQWSMLTTWTGEMAHVLARGPHSAWAACAVHASGADGAWQRGSAAFERLTAARAAVDAALRSDFAYTTAWREVVTLATTARADTLADIEQSRSPTPDTVAAHRFVSEACALFGLPALASSGEASNSDTVKAARGNDAAIEALVAMRTAVRAAAATRKTAGDAQALRATLAVCDAIRDTTLPALGYELRDGASGPVLVRRSPGVQTQ